ncbi:tRNA uridine-5-carboxymethylaminomethyl(34) synthesis GTPase MnmE, partial [Bacillus thuringiensis]|nr:tRNA uridine-5-carboxymethylaminomethyl(34) synthesis GTPase MnmE [Bacillus thuringiensis]
ADLVLLLIDASKELTAEDKSLINETDSKKRIIILNKSDLGQKITVEQMKKLTGSEVISTSILKEDNMDELEELINKLFFA